MDKNSSAMAYSGGPIAMEMTTPIQMVASSQLAAVNSFTQRLKNVLATPSPSLRAELLLIMKRKLQRIQLDNDQRLNTHQIVVN